MLLQDLYKKFNSYINKDGTLNINVISNLNLIPNVEHFNANIIPTDVYNSMQKYNINVNDLRMFVTNIDTKIVDMTDNILTNRISTLNQIKIYMNDRLPGFKRGMVEKKDKDPISILLIQNIDSIWIFFNRIVDMVIIHSQELKLKISTGANVEFFTLSPMINQIPVEVKSDINKILSKYGVSYDNVIEFISVLEISTAKLTSQSKINRLKILHIFKQFLSSISGYEYIFRLYASQIGSNIVINDKEHKEQQKADIKEDIKEDIKADIIADIMINSSNKRVNITDIQVQLMDVIYYIVDYVIDLHLKELYLGMTSDELKVGLYFEKFIRYYPKDTEVVKRELLLTNSKFSDIQNKITEYEKSKAELEKTMLDIKTNAEKQLLNAKVDAEKNIEKLRVDAEKNISSIKMDLAKYKADSEKYKTESEKVMASLKNTELNLIEKNIKANKEKVNTMVVLIVFILSCLLMTAIYFMK